MTHSERMDTPERSARTISRTAQATLLTTLLCALTATPLDAQLGAQPIQRTESTLTANGTIRTRFVQTDPLADYFDRYTNAPDVVRRAAAAVDGLLHGRRPIVDDFVDAYGLILWMGGPNAEDPGVARTRLRLTNDTDSLRDDVAAALTADATSPTIARGILALEAFRHHGQLAPGNVHFDAIDETTLDPQVRAWRNVLAWTAERSSLGAHDCHWLPGAPLPSPPIDVTPTLTAGPCIAKLARTLFMARQDALSVLANRLRVNAGASHSPASQRAHQRMYDQPQAELSALVDAIGPWRIDRMSIEGPRADGSVSIDVVALCDLDRIATLLTALDIDPTRDGSTLKFTPPGYAITITAAPLALAAPIESATDCGPAHQLVLRGPRPAWGDFGTFTHAGFRASGLGDLVVELHFVDAAAAKRFVQNIDAAASSLVNEAIAAHEAPRDRNLDADTHRGPIHLPPPPNPLVERTLTDATLTLRLTRLSLRWWWCVGFVR
jgi:hypothetical protein